MNIQEKDGFWIREWKINKKIRKIKFHNEAVAIMYQIRKEKGTTSGVIVKHIADVIFSYYVRLLKSDNLVCECITCKKKIDRKSIQNWHFRTRWHMKYRYDLKNCRPQCYWCNCALNGNYQIYTLEMQKLHWYKRVDDVINDHIPHSINQRELEEQILVRFEFIIQYDEFVKHIWNLKSISKKQYGLFTQLKSQFRR